MVTDTKPITIRELADALGMPKSTVSLALSGKGTLSTATREKVLAAARKHGYQPNPLAQRLAHGQSHDMICIISGPLDVGLGTEKVILIQKALTNQCLEVPLYTYAGPRGGTGESHIAQIQQICRQRPHAMVCAGTAIHPSAFPELEIYLRGGGILVSYDLPTPLTCDQVIFDREDNAYKATHHLLEKGHRKLGMGTFLKPEYLSDHNSMLQDARLRGFHRALKDFGVPLRLEWLLHRENYVHGGEAMARQFLALKDRPTGICIVNDHAALAFMDDVMRAGVRVPEDLSIVGHDNDPIAAHCRVPMTCVTHPVEKIVEAVVSLLRERIEGYSGNPRTVTIRGELIERQSSASPQKATPTTEDARIQL